MRVVERVVVDVWSRCPVELERNGGALRARSAAAEEEREGDHGGASLTVEGAFGKEEG